MFRDKRFIAVLLIALAIVVVLDIRYFMNRSDKQRPKAVNVVQMQPRVANAPKQAQPQVVAPKQAPYSPAQQVATWRKEHPLARGARNPFLANVRQSGMGGEYRPTRTDIDSATPAHLGAIAVVDGAMVALIDGEPVAITQQVGNLTIENIGPNRVTVRQGATRWAESLPPLPADGIHIMGNQ